jgi:hypothetical protein
MNLSSNFDLIEFTKSDYAIRNNIDNIPSAEGITKLSNLCCHVLELIRSHYNKPIKINSGYRSSALNKGIGGSESSQHSKCEAADIEIMGVDNRELVLWIKQNIDFDQLILEFYNPAEKDPNSGWVHVSYVSCQKNRHSILIAYKNEQGHTKYKEGII